MKMMCISCIIRCLMRATKVSSFSHLGLGSCSPSTWLSGLIVGVDRLRRTSCTDTNAHFIHGICWYVFLLLHSGYVLRMPTLGYVPTLHIRCTCGCISVLSMLTEKVITAFIFSLVGFSLYFFFWKISDSGRGVDRWHTANESTSIALSSRRLAVVTTGEQSCRIPISVWNM